MSNSTIQQALQEAKLLAQSNDIESALEILEQMLSDRPELPEIWVARAHVRALAKDRDGAERDMTQAIDLQDGEPDYYFTRGRYRLALNQLDAAVADFSKTIELSIHLNSIYYLDPAYLARAEAHLRMGRFDNAVADCEQIANADMAWPGVRSKHNILARCEQNS